MSGWLSIVALMAGGLAGAPPAADVLTEAPRYRIESPRWVLTDVPVSRVAVVALTPDGSVDESCNDQPYVTGIKLSLPTSDDAKLGPFHNGVLELTTDLAAGRKVYIIESEIHVEPETRFAAVHAVRRINRWWSLLPLAVALGMAIWLRNVIVALSAALFGGALVTAGWNPFRAFVATFETYLMGAIAPPPGTADATGAGFAHLELIVLALSLGGLAGVISAGGGLSALAARLERFSDTRERGQLLACAAGALVFFDVALHSLLVGPILRPITDRLNVSREKLAFFIDATAAPLAVLFIATTWFGLEVSPIRESFAALEIAGNVDTTLLASLPFCFYPVYLLVFALLTAWLGHDFGPMRAAENRAHSGGGVLRSDSVTALDSVQSSTAAPRHERALNAVLPLAILMALAAAGLWWTGRAELDALNAAAREQGAKETPLTFLRVLEHASAMRVLSLSSVAALVFAGVLIAGSRTLSVAETIAAGINGARNLAGPLFVLVLAWGFLRVCAADELNTAGFLMEILHGGVSSPWMPAAAFLLSAVIAFATGGLWPTVAILAPVLLAATHAALVDMQQAGPLHHLMLGTIGGMITGAVFGCQCSPMGETTVLASAGAEADHFDHVKTQAPYAAAVAGVALLLGYIPAGFGYSPVMLLPVGTLALFALVQFAGLPAGQVRVKKAAAAASDDAIGLDAAALQELIDETTPASPHAKKKASA